MKLPELRVQGSDNGVGIFGDDGKEGSGGRLRGASSALPVLDRIQTEAESVGESALRHLQAFSDALHINFGGQVDLVASRLPGQKGIHFFQSAHQVVKGVCHCLPHVLHWTPFVKGCLPKCAIPCEPIDGIFSYSLLRFLYADHGHHPG